MRHSNHRSGRHAVLSVCMATVLLSVSTLSAAEDDEVEATTVPQVEQKLKKLKKRVKQLETEVGELQALNLPVDVDVDCAAGDSINNVLQAHANGLGLLTISVAGTCTESVVIQRSNITLSGQAGAIIQAPSAPMFSLNVTKAAHNVRIENLTLRGPHGGAAINKNSHAVFSNIIAEQTNLAMVASDNGTMEITGSIIRNNNVGAYASRGGVALVSNSTVENNTTGLLAFKGGTVNVTSLMPDAIGPAGALVRNNTTGGVARSGGVLELSDSRIENNTGVGLLADSISAIHFFNSVNGTGTTISGNGTVGVLVQKSAGVVFSDATTTITGNNIGILCQPTSSYVAPTGPGNVTGNPGGNIVGCTP